MSKIYRIAGKIILYMCLAGLLFGLCVADAVPEENLSLFLLILFGLLMGCIAGGWMIGESKHRG